MMELNVKCWSYGSGMCYLGLINKKSKVVVVRLTRVVPKMQYGSTHNLTKVVP